MQGWKVRSGTQKITGYTEKRRERKQTERKKLSENVQVRKNFKTWDMGQNLMARTCVRECADVKN